VKKIITLLIEQLRYKRAMNVLAKQKWSVDFIIYLLRKSQIQGISFKITEPDGRVLTITSGTEVQEDYFKSEQHLSFSEWEAIIDGAYETSN
jgi:hypothetical protein